MALMGHHRGDCKRYLILSKMHVVTTLLVAAAIHVDNHCCCVATK